MADVTPLIRDELLPPRGPERRHLISITDLTKEDVKRLLALARTFAASLEREVKKLPALKGRTIVNVFYESSTRTSSSFELAAKRLSADVMSIKASGSAVDKGESLKDTALTIGAYDPDVVVLRHPHIGAPQVVANVTTAHVVNAGDGTHQHPTQALLDLYTIDEELGGIAGLHVAIVGDVLHSRVARSDIQALVRHLTSRGIGVLITDHNVRETLGLIDRAYIIHAGEVLTHGRANDIVTNPDVRRLYLGDNFSL